MVIVNCVRANVQGGLATFSRALVRCLQEQGIPCTVVANRSHAGEFGPAAIAAPACLAGTARISRLRPLLWACYAAVFPAPRGALILSTTHHALPFHRRQIVTIHDLRPYFFPDSWLQWVYFRCLLKRTLRRCDGILTVSETTRQTLLSALGVPADKVFVVPNAVDLSRFQPSGRPPQPFLLMVGANSRHKNLEEVLQFAYAWKGRYRLKVVGGTTGYLARMKSIARRAGLEEQIEWLGEVSRDRLIRLYQDCSAVVFPSKMEGFGLPPLEALACGRPAIVSDIAVFREIYGNSVAYVTLGDRGSWEHAVASLDDGDVMAAMIERGRQCAARYTSQSMGQALAIALAGIWNLSPQHRFVEATMELQANGKRN